MSSSRPVRLPQDTVTNRPPSRSRLRVTVTGAEPTVTVRLRLSAPGRPASQARSVRGAKDPPPVGGDAAKKEAARERARAKAREYNKAHRAELREYFRKWRAEHPGAQKEYYRQNRERLLAKARAYREAHREEINARARERYYQKKGGEGV